MFLNYNLFIYALVARITIIIVKIKRSISGQNNTIIMHFIIISYCNIKKGHSFNFPSALQWRRARKEAPPAFSTRSPKAPRALFPNS